MTNPTELVDTYEAAKLLGIKPATLVIWRSTGRYNLPFVKCGRFVRYKMSDLNQFIKERTFVQTL